ncbi:MAG: rhodanese-like domain-containing protein [Gallionella sp.]|nr:MAG: rhodanese-like domain-containing protein [Gallionella sp.]
MFFKLGITLFFLAGSTIGLAQVADISQVELMQRIKANHPGLILDVRSPEEYAEGHIPGAVNIPHDQLSSRLAEIGSYKNKDVVLYCKSGRRAGVAANTLRAAGFSKLLHLDGDMNGWLSKGDLPIKK